MNVDQAYFSRHGAIFHWLNMDLEVPEEDVYDLTSAIVDNKITNQDQLNIIKNYGYTIAQYTREDLLDDSQLYGHFEIILKMVKVVYESNLVSEGSKYLVLAPLKKCFTALCCYRGAVFKRDIPKTIYHNAFNILLKLYRNPTVLKNDESKWYLIDCLTEVTNSPYASILQQRVVLSHVFRFPVPWFRARLLRKLVMLEHTYTYLRNRIMRYFTVQVLKGNADSLFLREAVTGFPIPCYIVASSNLRLKSIQILHDIIDSREISDEIKSLCVKSLHRFSVEA